MKDLTIRDHALDAARPAVAVAPNEPLTAVARHLWDGGVGAAVVTTSNGIVGIISERDIVTQLALGNEAVDTTAGDTMTRTVAAARPDDRVLDVVHTMLDASIRHVPIVDEDGALLGMVSIKDLLRPLLLNSLGGTPGPFAHA